MFQLDPINKKRLARFRALKRGYWPFWILTLTYLLSLASELFVGNRPLYVSHQGQWHSPALTSLYYPETLFGGSSDLETDFRALAVDPEFHRSGDGF